uniref:Cohesin subunit SA n=1 Tax=Leptobrachium leishanense TaxID=445787 RepID=A0A8C5LZH0_9ANUR
PCPGEVLQGEAGTAAFQIGMNTLGINIREVNYQPFFFSPMQSVVDDWIEAYQEDRDVALLDLFNFYIQCSGCQGVVTAELFQNPNNQELKKKMTEEFDEDAEVYPMIKPGTYWKKFKANFCEFTTVLVQQCQYSVIYDGYLLDTVISLLLGLADSYVRAFRHTSTLSAMKLLSALVMVVLNLNVSLDNTERLLMVEKKRAAFKKTNSRLEQLDKKWRELQQQHQEIENFMEVLFKGTFVQRYRDVVPEIRALCIEELGIWMRLYPKVYLNDSCLKYIGWMLYDKVPEVRLKGLMALQGLYQSKEHVSKMDLFATRFKVNYTILLTLSSPFQSNVGIYLTENCEDVLTREDCETLYQFVYAAHRPLATAAGEFLYKRYLEFVISQTIPAICSNLISRPLLCLGKLHEHLTYLVDSLWECTSGFLKDWQCMSTVLLQDGNRGENALTANQESRLIELILASVRQAVEGHPPVGRGSSRKVLSAKEKRTQLEDSVKITEHFAGTLPLLLAKFISDPVKITNLLQIPQYFDMEIYSARSMDKNLEALLKQIHSIVENHSVPEVLEACSKAYQSLSNESLASHVRVSLSKRQLIEQLVDSFNQKLEDLLQQVSISLSRTVVPNRGPQVTPTGQVFQICEAFMSLCDLLLLLRGGWTSCCVDSGDLLSFVQGHVFQIKDEKNEGDIKDDETSLSHLHRRRSLLAGYCRLIAYNAVEMSAAAEIYKQYMKTYTDFGDIIKETLSRTRQNNRIESAKTLVLCLQQKHRELHGSATQSSTSFTNIKELARRFSLTFGMDHVKCRESIAMIHKLGIEFAFRERAEDGQPPPNLPFLILISEFSSKLLKADKRLSLIVTLLSPAPPPPPRMSLTSCIQTPLPKSLSPVYHTQPSPTSSASAILRVPSLPHAAISHELCICNPKGSQFTTRSHLPQALHSAVPPVLPIHTSTQSWSQTHCFPSSCCLFLLINLLNPSFLPFLCNPCFSLSSHRLHTPLLPFCFTYLCPLDCKLTGMSG